MAFIFLRNINLIRIHWYGSLILENVFTFCILHFSQSVTDLIQMDCVRWTSNGIPYFHVQDSINPHLITTDVTCIAGILLISNVHPEMEFAFVSTMSSLLTEQTHMKRGGRGIGDLQASVVSWEMIIPALRGVVLLTACNEHLKMESINGLAITGVREGRMRWPFSKWPLY